MLNHRRYILTLLLIPGLLASAGARAGQRNTALEIISRSPVLERFGLAPVVPVDQPRTMQELLIMAINRNRGMRSVAARVVGALDLVPQATALPDPTLTLVEYLDPVETRVGPQQRGYQLSQSFPWFGTLGVRGDIQRAKAATARARLDEQILAVITRVRTTALELAYLDSSIAVTHNHLMLLGQWEEAAQGRYAAGRGAYAALVKTQVELGKLSNRLAELEDRRTPLLAEINADLDRSPEAPLELDSLPVAFEGGLDQDELVRAMDTTNPRLAGWDHEAAAAVLSRTLAAKRGKPSFTLGLNLIETGPARMSGVADSGKNALMATLGIRLPLWRGKYKAMARQAASGLAAADDARRQELNGLEAELSRALFAHRDARRQAELYGGALVPKARQSLEAARAAFETGRGSYLDLIDAQRLLLEFQLAAVRARIDLQIRQATIEQLIAAPLTTFAEIQS